MYACVFMYLHTHKYAHTYIHTHTHACIQTGHTVTPTSNNGVKLEQFIFDCFPHSAKFACAEVLREEEFGPVKNAPGTVIDSPDTARTMLMLLGKK